MTNILRAFLMREKEEMLVRAQALRRALEVLGGTFAPIFLSIACIQGIALALMLATSGSMINALLGARGIGTFTSELTRTMWTLLLAGIVWEVSRMALSRLSGKLFETFAWVSRVVQTCALFFFLFATPRIGGIALLFTALALATRRTRWMHVVSIAVWFLFTIWIFFALSADVTLRVLTLGEAVRVTALLTALFVLFSRNAFTQNA